MFTLLSLYCKYLFKLHILTEKYGNSSTGLWNALLAQSHLNQVDKISSNGNSGFFIIKILTDQEYLLHISLYKDNFSVIDSPSFKFNRLRPLPSLKDVIDFVTNRAYKDLTVFLTLHSQRSAHSNTVVDDSFISVHTTSLIALSLSAVVISLMTYSRFSCDVIVFRN